MADFTGIKLAYDSTLTRGASVQLVFGFEYAILMVSVVNVMIKYALHVVDYLRANSINNNQRDNNAANRNWEEKAVYLLYSELALSGSKVILYLIFISLMMKIHTFPLFAIRPVSILIDRSKIYHLSPLIDVLIDEIIQESIERRYTISKSHL